MKSNASRWRNNYSWPRFLIPPYPLTNFEIQKYYQKEPKYNNVYSRNNLSEIKDGVYVINLDEHKSVAPHWIVLYLNDYNVTYFDSFGVKCIAKEIKKIISNKNIKTNIYKIQAND